MSLLSRIFRRTPSLRQRVAFTSAIGAAIVVVIVGHRGLVRHHRRVERAAGPQARRGGRDSRFRSCRAGSTRSRSRPTTRTPIITVRKGGQVTSNSDVVLPQLRAGLRRHLRRRRALPGAHGGHPAARADVGGRRGDLRSDHRRHQQPAPQGDHHLHPGDRRRDGRSAGCWPRSRSGRSNALPSRPARSTPATRSPTSRCAAPPRPSRSPRR